MELSSAIIKWHGFVGLEEVSEENLTKLVKLYKSIFNKELSELKYKDFDKLRKLDIEAIKEIKNLNSQDIDDLIKSLEAFEIISNLDLEEHAVKIKSMNEIYREFGVVSNWYKEDEQKKLKILLSANNITKLEDIDEDKSKALSLINRELKIDINKISVLKLKLIIKLLANLGVNASKKPQELASIIKFVNEIGGFKNLNRQEAVKVAKVVELIGIDKKESQSISKIIDLIKLAGIVIELDKNLDQEISKLERLSAVVKTMSGEEMSELVYLQIKEWINIVEGVSSKKILEAEEEDLKKAKEVLKLFPIIKDFSEGSNSYNLAKILPGFGIDIRHGNEVINLSQNIKILGINIWRITESKAKGIKEFLKKLEVEITESTNQVKLEKAIKINKYLGGKYDVSALENLVELGKIFGKKTISLVGISEIEIDELDFLKVITDHLELKVENAKKSNIKDLSELLRDHNISSAYEDQGILSKIWSGKNKGVTDKIDEIAAIYQSFGYKSLQEIRGEEKIKFYDLISINKRDSINSLTKEVAENIKGFFESLGINIKEESAYRVELIIEGLYQAGVDLFSSKEELAIYSNFVKSLNLKSEEINKIKGREIKEALKQVGYSGNVQELVEINEGIHSLYLPNILEIKEEQIVKIKEIGEAISGDKQEITPKVLKNIGKIVDMYKIAFEMPASTNVKYHKPDEKGLIDKIKKLQSFKIDLTSEERVDEKNNLIKYLSILYKDKCGKDSDSRIDYEKELTAMMSLSRDKLDNFIDHADSKKECLKIKDATIGQECEEFVKEIENEMMQLCPYIHEEL